ncbi:hypothetical protein ATANTOWER_012128 [Ataeniobius toweri]|uniref:Uncharacterized protein n=1 Tax=Ataeniobius toweri TaxID=208326 RepID=A0ABU7AF49_9TELE|nr:hypothetical protein [Ataeniobius toweri]
MGCSSSCIYIEVIVKKIQKGENRKTSVGSLFLLVCIRSYLVQQRLHSLKQTYDWMVKFLHFYAQQLTISSLREREGEGSQGAGCQLRVCVCVCVCVRVRMFKQRGKQ